MVAHTKVERPILVEVVWDDAQSDATKPITLKDVEDVHRPAVFQTLGWLLKDDAKGVSIANERCMDQGDESYRGHTFIIRSLVRSITPFKLTVVRKKRVKNGNSSVENSQLPNPVPAGGSETG